MVKKIRIFPRNQRGWIRIVEAFVAILLITGVILVVLNKGYIKKEDPSLKIYETENGILREISTEENLRNEVLGASPLPVEWIDFSLGVLLVKQKIEEKTPSYLECSSRICSLNDECVLNSNLDKDIYAKSAVITGNNTIYDPRQIKLFCWMKE